MPISVSTFVATSLDGFIARKDGSIDWLSPSHMAIPQEEDCGFNQFMSSVDAVVMGRNTFEQVLTFDKWVYGETPMVVLSSKAVNIPPHLQRTVHHQQNNRANCLHALSARVRNTYMSTVGLPFNLFCEKICLMK